MKKRGNISALLPVYIFVLAALIFAAIWGSRGVTVFTETAPLKQRQTVIIDAGHGTPDGGTTSCTGKLESVLNLEIALRLNDLMHLLGMDTVMIRTTETSVYTEGDTIGEKKVSDLKKRVKLVNELDNAVLISIHQNFFDISKYKGAQIFYNNVTGSKQLASLLQESLIQAVNPGSNRQVKKATGVYLMDHANCTSVLIECGFLSNPEEAVLLESKEYQMKLCSVLASSLSQYLFLFN